MPRGWIADYPYGGPVPLLVQLYSEALQLGESYQNKLESWQIAQMLHAAARHFAESEDKQHQIDNRSEDVPQG